MKVGLLLLTCFVFQCLRMLFLVPLSDEHHTHGDVVLEGQVEISKRHYRFVSDQVVV